MRRLLFNVCMRTRKNLMSCPLFYTRGYPCFKKKDNANEQYDMTVIFSQ